MKTCISSKYQLYKQIAQAIYDGLALVQENAIDGKINFSCHYGNQTNNPLIFLSFKVTCTLFVVITLIPDRKSMK